MKPGDWIDAHDGVARLERFIELPEEACGSLRLLAQDLVHYRRILNYQYKISISHATCALRGCHPASRESLEAVSGLDTGTMEKFEKKLILYN